MKQINRSACLLLLVLCYTITGAIANEATIEFMRHAPCNIFFDGETVSFDVKTRSKDSASLLLSVTDYDKKMVLKKEIDVAAGSAQSKVELGVLPKGYYEIRAVAPADKSKRSRLRGSTNGFVSFGVTKKITRTAKEVRDNGYRFGMKIWQLGKPGVWWRRPLVWKLDEVIQACQLMGLQWTRQTFNAKNTGNEPGVISIQDLLKKYEMNVVFKVEGIPAEAYDSKRFGPRETFSKRYKGGWSKSSMPLEEPYKKWLKGELQKLPPEQRVYEIWNEPWDWFRAMPGTEFGKLCTWIEQVLQEVHPNAIVGPNCSMRASTHCATPPYRTFGEGVLAGGGYNKADMIAIHPYSSASPEDKNFRVLLRNQHDFIKKALGHDLLFYATEYGWNTAPKGGVTEQQQAEYTVRESLMLYAEDVKTLIPHTMGQREQKEDDDQHWYGFFRLNMEPKPAIIAHAVCASMIDGGKFIGDLWYGPGIGAMIFEKEGNLILALWTEKENKKIDIDVKSSQVTLTDVMGRSKKLPTKDGKLSLTLKGDVQYLSGVGKELLTKIINPSESLIADRWQKRKGSFNAVHMAVSPVIDGKLDEWKEVPEQELENSKLEDIGLKWRFGWDSRGVYLAAKVKDHKIINRNAPKKIGKADSLFLNICGRPQRQRGGRDVYDYEFCFAPTSSEGKPVATMRNDLTGFSILPEKSANGVEWAVSNDATSWTVEALVPFEVLQAGAMKAGGKLAFDLWLFDRDREDINEWKSWWKRLELHNKKGRPDQRPYLILAQ